MLLVLETLSIEEVVHLLGHASTSSRFYLVKYFRLITGLLKPRINVLSNLNFTTGTEFLDLTKSKKTYTVLVAGPP